MLTPMQYESFVWPHNPRQYAIRFARATAVHKLPCGTYTVEDLGRTARVLEGSGEFFGPEAYATFRRLASLYYHQGPGVLLHPLWQSSRVYFDLLQLTQEPKEDFVRYAFRFVEAPPEQAVRQTQTPERVTLSAGDTLWGLAQQHGTSVEALLRLNPELATCNDAAVGEAVRLR